jgi:20S proteasome subunit alpha 4
MSDYGPQICVLFSLLGLTADARILIDKARMECQSHRLTVEDPVTTDYITRHIAGIQQVSVNLRKDEEITQ